MKNSKGIKAIEQVALNRGISVIEVRKEIEIAIDAAMSNPDPAIQALWEQYRKKGSKPTPEEFIVSMAKKVNK